MPRYKIRQLNWQTNGDTMFLAKSPLSGQVYRVEKDGRWHWRSSGFADLGGRHRTPWAAQQECQEHFESQIKPGLIEVDE